MSDPPSKKKDETGKPACERVPAPPAPVVDDSAGAKGVVAAKDSLTVKAGLRAEDYLFAAQVGEVPLAASWEHLLAVPNPLIAWSPHKPYDDLSTLVFGAQGISSPKENELADEISRLRKQLAEQTAAAVNAKNKSGQAERELMEARKSQEELQAKERLTFVLNRIHPDARPILLNSPELQKRFLESTTCEAYVMSIDIRRSTDLMLKTRRPELFAGFISVLCGKLRDIIIAHNGVFDKFTGDGVLAFFPDFYSGADAGHSVVAAADAAHALFEKHYNSSRTCFVSIIKDVGLGIGVDHGTVNLVQVGDGLTVVGTPVVYACRMGAAPAGTTLLNQPAYEQIFERFSEVCTFGETELDVKHEGCHLAYRVRLNGKVHKCQPAPWRSFDKGAA